MSTFRCIYPQTPDPRCHLDNFVHFEVLGPSLSILYLAHKFVEHFLLKHNNVLCALKNTSRRDVSLKHPEHIFRNYLFLKEMFIIGLIFIFMDSINV